MSKTITRRDLLKMTGGGLLGVILSPLPWKTLDDSAIWTQNWERTPKLSHGPIITQFSNCTLCPAGCALKVRSTEGNAFFLTGVKLHPFTHGALCARGIAGHHMSTHPLRIVHPHTFAGKSGMSELKAVSKEEAFRSIASRIRSAKGSVAVLDQQPNRTVSEIYEEFLTQTKNGLYLTSPSSEYPTLREIAAMTDRSEEEFGFDLEHSTLVLSFGAPLFDGWGIPGRMSSVRNAGTTKFIQVDDRRSHTAIQSDEWIALSPGTEQLFALSIASVMFRENLIEKKVQRTISDLASYRSIAAQFLPETTAPMTGIPAEKVISIARELASARSPIVLSGADAGGGPLEPETEKAIASLNLLLGNVGNIGGIVEKRQLRSNGQHSRPTQWNSIPDHSIEVLIMDSADAGFAIPWKLLEKKLIPNGHCIVSLSPVLNEISAHADFLIPAPGHLESLTETPSAGSSCTASFALSAPVMPRQEFSIEPIDVIRELSRELSSTLEIPEQEVSLKQKTERIMKDQRGSVFIYADGSTRSISEYAGAEELWTDLVNGAQWIDDPVRQSELRSASISLQPVPAGDQHPNGLVLIPHGWKGTTSYSQMPPVLSKIFQESDLRKMNGTVSIHPATAAALGLLRNEFGVLSTKNGSMNVRIKVDPTVRPAVVNASIGPLPNGTVTPEDPVGTNILNLCEVTDKGTWRITAAQLVKA